MKTGKELIHKIVSQNTFGTEPMPGQVLVEWFGTCRVRIENHCGVCSYDSELICVRAKDGYYRIQGRNLMISLISKHMMVISGTVLSVCFDGDRANGSKT